MLARLGDVAELDFGLALDALDVGVVVLDRHGCIIAWNDWIARTSGLARSAAQGKSLFDVFPALRQTRLPAAVDDSFQAGSASILTHSLNKLLPLKSEDGRELLHNIVVRPISSPAVSYCLLQVNDVTLSVTRERVLRERQNARYQAIVDSAPDAIITTSLDRRIQWLNDAAEQVFGYPRSELMGEKIDILLDSGGDLLRAFADGAQASTAGGSVQVVGRRRDGASASFDVSFGRWQAEDRVFVTTIWRDVTDLVEARDALRRSNEELEGRVAERTREREMALNQLHESQKMETIGQLTGGVAHDFNNLLAIILGSLTLLGKGLPEDQRTSRLLQGAVQAAERGATLTKRLLAFARRQELKFESVDVQKLVPDMLDFLRQSVGPGISIDIDILPDVQPIKIDANQLELALMNLAVNARDAMPKGGSLSITCRNETRAHTELPVKLPAGEYVRISVADTGEGMSAATLAKAMEPFFTTKGVGKGTGLGLSMVHGLTAQAGGAMHISSQLGRGTGVSLWLPRAAAEDLAKVPDERRTPSPEIAGRRLRILLVDDDSLVSMNTAYMLMDLGHSVLEAESGAHALRLLEAEGQFDLIVTDYAMPGMTGLDLAMKVKQIRPRLPIVLATGYAELPTQRAVDFPRLNKPYSQDELSAALQHALAGAQE
jgi:PAS domain S-box-containing protein